MRDVAHVHEVAALAAVLEHARDAAGGERRAEDARDAGVRRVARHPRTVNVVVAQGRDGRAGLARERRGQMLLRDLGGGVHVARVLRRVLRHRLRVERRAANRARRLEAAGVEIVRRARRRPDDPVLRAGVAALAVDDHARGEHEPAREPRRRQRAQEHGGAEVVVGHVVGDVADVGAEAHHRRLVADRSGAGDRPRGRGGVADVALEPLGARVEVVRPLAVRGRQQAVEDAHLVPALEQRVDDVGADEAGAAGDEDRSQGARANL